MEDTCTPMFITALFTIARTWTQPRCPSAYEWIRKLWYIYTMEYYQLLKRTHASPGSMHDTGYLGLVHWDHPEGWYREGGRSGVQDGEHMYTHVADSC